MRRCSYREGQRGRGLLWVPGLVLFGVGASLLWRRADVASPTVEKRIATHAPVLLPVNIDEGWGSIWAGLRDGVSRERHLLKAAQKGTPAAVEFLVEVASSEDRHAHHAAAALGRVENLAARETLRVAARSENVLTSSNAVRALGNLGGEEPTLKQIAQDRRGTRMWHEAIRSLGCSRETASRLFLEKQLGEQNGEQERLTILHALREAANPQSLPALEQFASRGDLTEADRTFAQAAVKACRMN